VRKSDLQNDNSGESRGLWPARASFLRVRWNRAVVWIVAEILLLSLLWVNVLASESPPRNFTGRALIVSPTNAAALSAVHEISGLAYLPKGALGRAEIRLRQVATRKCWDWTSDGWRDEGVLRIPLSEGIAVPWNIVTPELAEGRYQVECTLQLEGSVGPSSISSFVLDRTTPSIGFFPLHDQQTVDDLSDVGGEIDEPAEVHFSISRLSEAGQSSEWWDGNSWSQQTSSIRSLAAATAHGFWFRAAETSVPQGQYLEPGTYLILVSAIDRAGNEGRAAVTVHKRPAGAASPNRSR
jgi:hypothetical protein